MVGAVQAALTATTGPVLPTIWDHLIDQLPNIIAQTAVLVVALGGFYRVWSTRTKQIQETTKVIAATTQTITEQAASAKVAAEAAAVKAEEVHETTKTIAKDAEKAVQQTNGQLSRLLDDKEALETALRQILTIVSAREGKIPGVRGSDLDPEQNGVAPAVGAVVQALGSGGSTPPGPSPSGPPAEGERRTQGDRRGAHDHPEG